MVTFMILKTIPTNLLFQILKFLKKKIQIYKINLYLFAQGIILFYTMFFYFKNQKRKISKTDNEILETYLYIFLMNYLTKRVIKNLILKI